MEKESLHTCGADGFSIKDAKAAHSYCSFIRYFCITS